MRWRRELRRPSRSWSWWKSAGLRLLYGAGAAVAGVARVAGVANADRVVERQEHAHVVAGAAQVARQRAEDVGEAAGLRVWRELRRDAQDVHGATLSRPGGRGPEAAHGGRQ